MKENYTKLLNNIDHVVLLRRKNLTEQVVSLKVAETFGYHSDSKKPDNKKITLDVSELKSLANYFCSSYYFPRSCIKYTFKY
jgi:hypothetical protein